MKCLLCGEPVPAGKACDVGHAFQFAVEYLLIRRGTKAQNYDPEKFVTRRKRGHQNIADETKRLEAISIICRAEACDPGDDKRPSWFLDWWMPEPDQPRPAWTDHERRRLYKAICEFQCLLCEIQVLGECGDTRRMKKCRRR